MNCDENKKEVAMNIHNRWMKGMVVAAVAGCLFQPLLSDTIREFNEMFKEDVSAAKITESFSDQYSLLIQEEEETSEFGLKKYVWKDEDGREVDMSSITEEGGTDISGTVSVEESNKKTTFSGANNNKTVIPESYDLRNVEGEALVTSAKDQGKTGCCWAFGSLGSIESNLLCKGLADLKDIDLSELHLTWFTYHASADKNDPMYGEGRNYSAQDAFYAGGNYLFATATLGRGSGTRNESDFPFSDSVDNMDTYMQEREDSRYTSDYLLTDSLCIDDASTDRIKEIIMENGAVSVCYYAAETTSPYYYESEEGGMAYYGSTPLSPHVANHMVLIVGWDDNYSRNNFWLGRRPSSSGAWLIRNSWGEEWGDEGFFWLSYEDTSIEEIVSMEAEEAPDNLDIYQYDASEIATSLISGEEGGCYAANVFTAGYTSTIEAISFYTMYDEQPYEIRIYEDITENTPPSPEDEAACVMEGVEEFRGYHTLELGEGVQVERGHDFCIEIRYGSYNDEGTERSYIPMEMGEEGSIYQSGEGESFIYQSGEWIDLYGNYITAGSTKYYCHNVPVKAISVIDTTAEENVTRYEKTSKVTMPSGNSSGGGSGQRDDHVFPQEDLPETVPSESNANTFMDIPSDDSEADITVVSEKIEVKKIKITKKKKEMKVGATFKLKYKILPADASNKKVTFTSTKKKVASVNKKGRIKAKHAGKTTITIKSANGKKASFVLKVK